MIRINESTISALHLEPDRATTHTTAPEQTATRSEAAIVELSSVKGVEKPTDRPSNYSYENLQQRKQQQQSDESEEERAMETAQDSESMYNEITKVDRPRRSNLQPIEGDPMGTIVKMTRTRRQALEQARNHPQEHWTAARATLQIGRARQDWINEITQMQETVAADAETSQQAVADSSEQQGTEQAADTEATGGESRPTIRPV